VLRKLDYALEEAKHINIRFCESNLRRLLLSCVKGASLTELAQLPKLLELLRKLSEIVPLSEIRCKEYSTPLVRGWCNRYNERTRKFSEKLRKITEMLQELNLSKIDQLEELRRDAERIKEDVEKYRRNLISRIRKIIESPPISVESFEEVLKLFDRGIAELKLTPEQQRILELLSERREIGLEELVNKLQEEGISEVSLLHSLYDLCFRGIVKCLVEL